MNRMVLSVGRSRIERKILTTNGWYTVMATEINIPGFEEFEFFIHRDLHVWQLMVVSEASSGRIVAAGWPSAIAIQSAQETLNHMGKEAFKAELKRVNEVRHDS